MFLIRNITNIPITIEDTTIYPGSSVEMDIEYTANLSALEKTKALSVMYIEAQDTIVEDIPIVTPVKRRRRRQSISESIDIENDKNNLKGE